MLFVSALCLAACSDDPDVAPLKRDTDAVELTYNSGATTQISVRYAGSWSARVECTDGSGAPVNNWFSVSPDNGVGNGRDYQWVTVTAERNPGDKRTGYIYLKPANGEEIKIEVAQADGHFSVNDPVISGTLKSKTESAALLESGPADHETGAQYAVHGTAGALVPAIVVGELVGEDLV